MARFRKAQYWIFVPGDAGSVAAVPHEVLVKRAHLLSVLGRWEKAESDLLKCRTPGGIPGQAEFSSQVLLELAGIRINQSRLGEARELIGDYESGGLDSAPERKMNLTNLKGKLAFYQGDLTAAKCGFRRVMELAESSGQQIHKAQAGLNLGNISVMEGDMEAAESFYRKALTISEELQDVSGIGMALGGLGILAAERGEHQRALECFRRDLDIGLRLGQAQTVAQTHGNIGQLLADMGRFHEAMDSYQEQLEITRRIGDAPGTFNALYCLASCASELGKPAEASDCLRRAADHGIEWSMATEAAKALLDLAGIQVEAGETEAARATVAELLALGEEVRDRSLIERALSLKGRIG